MDLAVQRALHKQIKKNQLSQNSPNSKAFVLGITIKTAKLKILSTWFLLQI